MGDIGFEELVVIVIIAIIVYGKNLPQAARKLATFYGKLKRQVSDLRDEIQRQLPPEELNLESKFNRTPPPKDPPPTPTGLGATSEPGQIYLSWASAPGATSYSVKRLDANGDAWTVLATGLVGTGYTDLSLPEGVTQRYVVSAVNAAGESPNSDEVSACPTPAAPERPVEATSPSPAPPGNGTPGNGTPCDAAPDTAPKPPPPAAGVP